MSKIQIFDRGGFKLTEIVADADRSWLINEYGHCEFTLPVIDANCRKRFLQFGNLILIEHPKLPKWGGVIDVPRKWGNNLVTITAYTAEYLFKFRDTTYGGAQRTPGEIYRNTIRKINVSGDIRVKEGTIWDGGKANGTEVKRDNAYDFIKNELDKAEVEWCLIPQLDAGGRLYFDANLYEKLGDPKAYELKEGVNIELNEDTLTEDGVIANHIFGIGTGATWNERPKYDAVDLTSENDYGWRDEKLKVEHNTVGKVEEESNKELNKRKNPEKNFDLSVLDYGLAWLNLALGNELPVHLSVCGFNGDKLGTDAKIRIKGMAYLENKGVVRLILDDKYDDTK